ncbi:MAG: decarboxylating 6-phosphogluconate dehydrogenase [Candidatus Eremiobacteraeota bacterium]|nr:decarboxylating 6-phosphogluconate dehydrogenase [Candidatus Eremiobacteraeota bacterium]MBV8499483.1 decarboxylating 6-phosphogluconate dehydrogenase [Candidatus Eremiobacteraeota bacterium]
MQLGMVGLGKMGNYMTQRLIKGSHQVVAFDRDSQAVAKTVADGATGANSLADMAAKLTESPKVAWVMVPAGPPTDDTIHALADALGRGGIIIDGGNTNYKDGLRLYDDCKAKGVSLIDAGTSGGVWGLTEGYCLMVGGDDAAVRHCEPIFITLAPPKGYAHVGPPGAGHFSKMVHNGIEYGLLQAYGEGFEILKDSQYDFDLGQLAELWTHASVVRSWLLELLVAAFREDPGLKDIRGYVDDTGEGRWTVQAAIDENVPAPVITLSLFARMASRQDESFSAKVVAALRNQFGGHAVQSEAHA